MFQCLKDLPRNKILAINFATDGVSNSSRMLQWCQCGYDQKPMSMYCAGGMFADTASITLIDYNTYVDQARDINEVDRDVAMQVSNADLSAILINSYSWVTAKLDGYMPKTMSVIHAKDIPLIDVAMVYAAISLGYSAEKPLTDCLFAMRKVVGTSAYSSKSYSWTSLSCTPDADIADVAEKLGLSVGTLNKCESTVLKLLNMFHKICEGTIPKKD